jgi:hypothetical protein
VEAPKKEALTISRAEAVKKILEEMDLERLRTLKTIVDGNLDAEYVQRAGDLDERTARLMEIEGIIADQYGMKQADWTPKRIAWAIASILAGAGAAWLLQKKLPAMNHAASGVTGGLVFEKLGLRGQKSFIGNAAGGLAGTWCNQNFQIGEIALAAPAFAYTVFSAGEDFMSAWEERKRQQEAAAKKQAAAPKTEAKAEPKAN